MADQTILAQGNVRVFIQEDGINPAAAYKYYGCMSMDSPSQDQGTPDPVYCPSSTQRNKWEIIDDIPKAQALGSFDFTQHASRYLSEVWMDFKRRGCKVNLQAVAGSCSRPDDFTQWDAKIAFMSARLSTLGMSPLNPLSGDDNAAVDWTGTFNFRDWDVIRAILFGEVADSTLLTEALDGFYYDTAQCGECGAPSDGCNALYILAAASTGSPGLSGQLLYSLDKGATWAGLDINSLAGKTPDRFAPMGDKVVVVSQASASHHYARVSAINAGTIGAWTQVTTGYVATKGPRAIYVKNSSAAFIAAAGGYIYYLTNPTGSVSVLTDGSISAQNLNDISGSGNTIVAVGGSNAMLVSSNGGSTFSLVTGPVVGVNLTSVWCQSSQIWLVGTGTGRLFYTLNAGSTWTEIGLGVAGVTVINDIRFFDDVVGYLAAEVNGAATVFRTTDSGNTWQNTSPHISGLPAAVRANFVFPCGRNRVLAGGRKTVGGDGLAAIAS
jgi:photosystem II stability/assembly factor-like uncharacterized protein